jgi:8-oxo-dGTP pyrophosphatase MutT (NUDIX family)
VLASGRLLQLIVRLQALARPTLAPDLVPLRMGNAQIGLMRPDVAHFLTSAGLVSAARGGGLSIEAATLMRAAVALRDSRLLRGWREEQLPVRSGARILGSIERAACRPLGIATDAVHLNAYADDNTVIVARRALNKQIDPGMWDNLVGGMVPHGESLETTLAREALEEAGLRPEQLHAVRGRSFQVRRPVAEGLQDETVHVYDASLHAPFELHNQDGEVAAIEARSVDNVVAAIERDEFTLEAALVMLESLTRRRNVATPAGLYL